MQEYRKISHNCRTVWDIYKDSFCGNKSTSAEVINMQGWDNYLLKDTE